jgi:pyruvate/2-oxoglutarate dehydrogenase complex dihydrolipoamide dehydrogenase (E3) component
MTETKVDLCVIGAGSAGLSVAAGAAQLGLSVILFEAGDMGGDCLNVGCVPSKALIAAAKRAHDIRDAGKFGVHAEAPRVDWAHVKTHIDGVIAAIAPNDSQERFEGLGVQVVREHARFTDAHTVESKSMRVRAARFVIATGSRPLIPPIPGLDETPHLTNETIFSISELPKKLLIIGAGAIGMELGQAFRRLGSEVVIIEAATALGNADREAAAIVAARLKSEGVQILENHKAVKAAKIESGISLAIEGPDGMKRPLEGSHLLVAVGRNPALQNLGLDTAGIAHDRKGVAVSDTLRSISNKKVWALGDAAGKALFTHAAGWHASVFVRNVLFKARTKFDAQPMPAVTFTDPELAQIGLTETEARVAHGDDIKTTRWSFEENDRAQAQRDTEGFCKLVLDKNARLLGATIVGAEAGELIATLALAMSQKLKLRALTDPILPYPTRAEIIKRAASAHFTPVLFSDRTRFLVSLLQRIP